MKSIKSLVKWILFVPVCLLSVALITIYGLYPAEVKDFFTTDVNGIAEIIEFSVLGLFLVCFVLSLFDRTTSPVHILRKNYFCGATAFIGAFALAATAALDVTDMVQINNFELMTAITAGFTALSGVALLFIGINHLTGTNTPKEISMFYLVLPLWCGVHLIDRFLKHTAMPVDAADTMDLVMFVALAMFFTYATMVHAVIPGKNAVKSAITFGFPAVIISLVYGISLVFSVLNSDSNSFIDFIPAIGYCVIGLYTLGFTAELSFVSKSVEEQMVLELSDNSENLQESVADSEDSFTAVSVETEEKPDDFEMKSEPVVELASEQNTAQETDEADYEDITLFEEASPTAVRVAEEETEISENTYPQVDIPVNLPEVFEEEPQESDIAEELYKAAQERDSQSDAVEESFGSGSDENMIIDGEEFVTPVSGKAVASESRPKGPTTREAIMYDDEDFILTIDALDDTPDVPAQQKEDISSFILESEDESREAGQTVEKTYADRLDEIDQLIISIQGGDSDSVD